MLCRMQGDMSYTKYEWNILSLEKLPEMELEIS